MVTSHHDERTEVKFQGHLLDIDFIVYYDYENDDLWLEGIDIEECYDEHGDSMSFKKGTLESFIAKEYWDEISDYIWDHVIDHPSSDPYEMYGLSRGDF